jgi:predicted metal-dependent HD superfamily phosphohydrolase
MNLPVRNRWKELWTTIGAAGEPELWLDRLIAAYSEPHRRYHNLRHIAECQNEYEPVRHLASSPESVELAIWFHDAVYDPRKADNEEQSATLAEQCLREAKVEGLASKVVRLVLATKQHDVDADPDAALLVDVDLSILGQPDRRFTEYEDQIRQEYSWVEDSVFFTKRSEILMGFLSRSRIYSTGWFYEKYEAQARANLERSIIELRSASSGGKCGEQTGFDCQ